MAESRYGAGSSFTTGAIIASFLGDSDALRIRNITTGDYFIYNDQQNNGIAIYDTGSGVKLVYNGVAVAEVTREGGFNFITGG